MSTAQLMAAVRAHAQMAQQRNSNARVGTVSNFDPNTWTVMVLLLPDGTQTNWLPLLSPWIGNGWGLFAPPNIGDLVDVHFAEGNTDGGFVTGRFFNDQNQPLPVPSGEFWLVHAKGGVFKLLNSGAVLFSDGHGASVQLNGDGTITSAASTWNHTGDVNITGNVAITGNETVTGKITGQGGMAISGGTGAAMQVTGDMHSSGTVMADTDVIASGKSGKSHTHNDPQGGTTGPPN